MAPAGFLESLVTIFQRSFFYPEDGSSRFLRNVGNDIVDYMVPLSST
jgi:hypothetical protein